MWRPPPDQRIWYKICPAPNIRRSTTNLHCIFKSPIQSYQIKTHTNVPYPCYHGNALSINNYTSTAQSYIYIYTFPVILVVSVKYMPVTCNYRTINWFFKFFKFYECPHWRYLTKWYRFFIFYIAHMRAFSSSEMQLFITKISVLKLQFTIYINDRK